jgi:hypothetical protein
LLLHSFNAFRLFMWICLDTQTGTMFLRVNPAQTRGLPGARSPAIAARLSTTEADVHGGPSETK